MELLSSQAELGFNVGFYSEKDAQMCIYDASWDTHFGFGCDIDHETSQKLACKISIICTDVQFNFFLLETKCVDVIF